MQAFKDAERPAIVVGEGALADPAVLAGYKIAPRYETMNRVSVKCGRFDELHSTGRVPAPDVSKVDVEGYEHNEIAGIVGCSIGNSKSQLHKARMKLRDILRVKRAEKAGKS